MQQPDHASEPHLLDRYIATRRETEPRFNKQALAKQAGVSRNAIYRVMGGDDAVSTDLLEKIEAATGISSVELFAAWKAARDRLKTTAA